MAYWRTLIGWDEGAHASVSGAVAAALLSPAHAGDQATDNMWSGRLTAAEFATGCALCKAALALEEMRYRREVRISVEPRIALAIAICARCVASLTTRWRRPSKTSKWCRRPPGHRQHDLNRRTAPAPVNTDAAHQRARRPRSAASPAGAAAVSCDRGEAIPTFRPSICERMTRWVTGRPTLYLLQRGERGSRKTALSRFAHSDCASPGRRVMSGTPLSAHVYASRIVDWSRLDQLR